MHFFNFFIELLDAYITDVSQSTTHSLFLLYNASRALDKDHDTLQHFDTSSTGPHWWKVVFNTTVFLTKVKIINRRDCCKHRSINLDIITTLSTRGQKHNSLCENTGIFVDEKTVDCYHLADEMTIYKNASLRFNLAEVYLFGKVF